MPAQGECDLHPVVRGFWAVQLRLCSARALVLLWWRIYFDSTGMLLLGSVLKDMIVIVGYSDLSLHGVRFEFR